MLIKTLLLAAFTLACNCAYSDQVRIPIGEQSDVGGIPKPAHGITKAEVESQFGAPESRRGPVGDPAIYFWEYKNFTVYFESDRVIHSVSKMKSKKALRK